MLEIGSEWIHGTEHGFIRQKHVIEQIVTAQDEKGEPIYFYRLGDYAVFKSEDEIRANMLPVLETEGPDKI